MKRVAFVTEQRFPALVEDDLQVVEPLRACGITIEGAVWDDPAVRWTDYDAVVMRSTWDYYLKSEAFFAWLDALEAQHVPLWNPLHIVRWNADKSYLLDLKKRGVTIVDSVLIPRGGAANLTDVLREQGWTEAIYKPTISAGAHKTARFTQATAAAVQAEFDALLKDSAALIQPFVAEIASKGEWSLLFFDKQYSHTVLKTPQSGDFRVQEHLGGKTEVRTPPPHVLKQAEAILQTIDAPLLYARVDGVEIDGTLHLMELELIEPFLFMGHAAPQAVERFANAIAAKVS